MSTALKASTLAAVAVLASGSTSSLASGSNALSANQDPTAAAYGGSGTAPGYQRGRYRFFGTFGAAPSANAAIRIYHLLPGDDSLTGTPGSYESDLGRATSPPAHCSALIPLDTVNASQNRCSEEVLIPAVPHKVIVENAGSGQAIASGWSLTFVPSTDAGV